MVFGFGFAITACSSDDEHPVAPSSSAGSGAIAGALVLGGQANSGGRMPAAGVASVAGAGGASGESQGGETGESGAGGQSPLPPPVPYLCDPTTAFAGLEPLTRISTDEDDLILGLSSDENTLVFAAGQAIYRSERNSRTGEFQTSSRIEAAEFVFDPASITLSSDGLRLIGVLADRPAFAELTRSSRVEEFGALPDETPFTTINSSAAGLLGRAMYADPVLSENDERLFYSSFDEGPNAVSTVFESLREEDSESWPAGDPSSYVGLFAQAGALRRPRSLSGDGRTLFYWDEVSRQLRAAYRRTIDLPFEFSIEVGDYQRAIANHVCDRLYVSAASERGLDLFVATREQ
ncbi:MAG TPA: hypothetical protein VFQ61_36980 [Polyangiaceae bacterium]|nr:hypothetical protein [Polyangiaceae bacterium]